MFLQDSDRSFYLLVSPRPFKDLSSDSLIRGLHADASAPQVCFGQELRIFLSDEIGYEVASEGQVDPLLVERGEFFQPAFLEAEDVIMELDEFKFLVAHNLFDFSNDVFRRPASDLLPATSKVVDHLVIETIGTMKGATAAGDKHLHWELLHVGVSFVEELPLGKRKYIQVIFQKPEGILDDLGSGSEREGRNICRKLEAWLVSVEKHFQGMLTFSAAKNVEAIMLFDHFGEESAVRTSDDGKTWFRLFERANEIDVPVVGPGEETGHNDIRIEFYRFLEGSFYLMDIEDPDIESSPEKNTDNGAEANGGKIEVKCADSNSQWEGPPWIEEARGNDESFIFELFWKFSSPSSKIILLAARNHISCAFPCQ